MTSQHLRIGNYIMDSPVNGDEPLEVEAIYSNFVIHGETHVYNDEIRPIPLTAEWLLKFGFTLDIGVGVWFSTQKHFPIWNAYGGRHYQYTLGNPSHNINISTVHQLQNIYQIICGEELKIKL